MVGQTDGALLVAPIDEVDLEVPYNLLLWDDPVSTMDYVVYAIGKVLEYSLEKCNELMMYAHMNGKVVAWTGEREQAQAYAVALHGYGLQATIVKSA